MIVDECCQPECTCHIPYGSIVDDRTSVVRDNEIRNTKIKITELRNNSLAGGHFCGLFANVMSSISLGRVIKVAHYSVWATVRRLDPTI
jgi:hypothetical protein